jgi:hypothetical protein
LDKQEKNEEITDFGLRHHSDNVEKKQRKTIYDVAAGDRNESFD